MTPSGWLMMLSFVGGVVLLFVLSVGRVISAPKEDNGQSTPDSDDSLS